jgi:nucleoside 2-deoxyribosyltransferase
MLKVYLAGPEVFLPHAIEIGAKKKRICDAHGLIGLFPLDKEVALEAGSPADLGTAIYHANIGLMNEADAIIANMTPFRGPSMDVGTAFEVGFCTARGIPVFGYTNVASKLIERIDSNATRNGIPVDKDGLDIENFGFYENLMIEVPVRQTGGVVASPAKDGATFANLVNFERAVRRAADMLLQSTTASRLHA